MLIAVKEVACNAIAAGDFALARFANELLSAYNVWWLGQAANIVDATDAAGSLRR